MSLQTHQKDPRELGPKPSFSRQEEIEAPGLETEMHPKPDHGEETYKGFGRLKDRVALITGGDSGIGRAIALAYAREGAHIAINYLPQEEADATESASWVERAGVRCLKLPGDLQDPAFCKSLIDRVLKLFGRLDILVNNAAYQMSFDTIDKFTNEEIDKAFRTNIMSMMWLSRDAIPLMKPGSSIINSASIQAFNPSPNLLAYAATKGAIVNFTKGLAKLAMKQGIRVNAVAPGPVWTPLIPSSFPKGKIESFGKETIMGRPAQPADIAPIYVFLATDDARYVTGECYGCVGGKMPF
jgi:hypothetical protein